MKFGIFIDNPKPAKKYFEKTKQNFEKNKQANSFVQREVEYFNFTSDMIVGINFSTIFPIKLFRYISFYLAFFATATQIIFGWGLFVGMFGVFLLNLPALIESPLFVYLVIKRQLRKFGYKGGCYYMRRSELERSVQWV